MGVAGCYKPKENTICLGRESAIGARMFNEENETIRFLTDVICHEEDHRAIHEVTGSQKAALTFDLLFRFNFKANCEYFRYGKISTIGNDTQLTSYGKMYVKKCEAQTKIESGQTKQKGGT